MLANPYYFREPSHLYPLQSHSDYWFCVGESASKQVIIGLAGRKLLTVIFNNLGDMVDLKDNDILTQAPSGDAQEFERLQLVFREQVDRQRESLGLTDGQIHIKQFRLRDLNIGIDDLPDDLQAYALAPKSCPPSERADSEETIQGWKEEDLFVFWWGQSFTIDNEGIVTSS